MLSNLDEKKKDGSISYYAEIAIKGKAKIPEFSS